MKHKKFFARAFALVELLGAVAVVATIATISVISVKGTIAAGQKSAVQKELQNLNTSLQNFRSAGGVIQENAAVADVLAALQAGVDIGGGAMYAPLTTLPDLESSIGGIPYTLAYDPITGFSAVPSGATIGEVLSGGGEMSGVGAEGVAFPFDITDPAATAQAIADFEGMSPGDPEYQSYLDAFNAAGSMNTLASEDMIAVGNAVNDDVFALLNPRLKTEQEVTQELFTNYGANSFDAVAVNAGYSGWGSPSLLFQSAGVSDRDAWAATQGFSTYDEFVSSNWGYDPGIENVAMWWGYLEPGSPSAMMAGSYGFATMTEVAQSLYGAPVYPDLTSEQAAQLSAIVPELNSANLSLLSINPSLTQNSSNAKLLIDALNSAIADGSYANLSAAQVQDPFYNMVNAASKLSNNSLAGVDLSEFDPTGKDLGGGDFSGALGLTGEKLNSAAGLGASNLSGLDLTGFDPTGKYLEGIDFTGTTGLTGAQFSSATSIRGSNLSGLVLADFTPHDLQNTTLSGATFSGSSLNGVTEMRWSNLSGTDLAGFNPSGKDLWGVNLSGATGITGAQLNQASNLFATDLSRVDLTGFTPTNKDLRYVNLTGATNLTGSQLNGATNFGFSNLSGLDLTGFNPTGKSFYGANLSGTSGISGTNLSGGSDFSLANLSRMNLSNFTPAGKSLRSANLNGASGLTAASLAQATSIAHTDLRGTGITRAQLDAALAAAGKEQWAGGPFHTATITFD